VGKLRREEQTTYEVDRDSVDVQMASKSLGFEDLLKRWWMWKF
jgi:hypothetical protein